MKPYTSDSVIEGAESTSNSERGISLGPAMRPYEDPHHVDTGKLARVQAFDAGHVSSSDDVYPEAAYSRRGRRRGRLPYGVEHDGSAC